LVQFPYQGVLWALPGLGLSSGEVERLRRGFLADDEQPPLIDDGRRHHTHHTVAEHVRQYPSSDGADAPENPRRPPAGRGSGRVPAVLPDRVRAGLCPTPMAEGHGVSGHARPTVRRDAPAPRQGLRSRAWRSGSAYRVPVPPWTWPRPVAAVSRGRVEGGLRMAAPYGTMARHTLSAGPRPVSGF